MALYTKEDFRLPAAELSDLENLREWLKFSQRHGFFELDCTEDINNFDREVRRWLELLDKLEKIVR